jgi:hypothetical protein
MMMMKSHELQLFFGTDMKYNFVIKNYFYTKTEEVGSFTTLSAHTMSNGMHSETIFISFGWSYKHG